MTPIQESWAWLAGAAVLMAVLFVTPALVTTAPNDQSADGLTYLAGELGCYKGTVNRTFTRAYRPVDGPLGRWHAVDRVICRDVEKARAQVQALVADNDRLQNQNLSLNREIMQAREAYAVAKELEEQALIDAEEARLDSQKARESERTALQTVADLTAFNETQRQTIADRDRTIERQSASLQNETAQNARLRADLTQVTQALSQSEQNLIEARTNLAEAQQAGQNMQIEQRRFKALVARSTARSEDLAQALETTQAALAMRDQALSDFEAAKALDDQNMAAAQAQIAELTGERDALSARLLNMVSNIQSLETALSKAETELLGRDQNLQAYKSEMEGLRQKFQQQQAELAQALTVLGVAESELSDRIAQQDALISQAEAAERQAALLREENRVYLAQLGLFQGVMATVAQWDRASDELADLEVFTKDGGTLSLTLEVFDSGSPEIRDSAVFGLERLAQTLVTLQNNLPEELNWAFLVRRHADGDAISTDRFPSNWELSAARAASVVRYLEAQGVVAWRLQASGQSNAVAPHKGAPARRISIDFQPRINDLVIENGL